MEKRKTLISRYFAISVYVAAFLIAILFASKLTLEDDYRSFFPKNDKSAVDYGRYLKSFPGDSGALVVALGEYFCTAEGWKDQVSLANALKHVDGVERVDSLATAKHVIGRAAELEVLPFVEVDSGERNLCDVAFSKKLFLNSLISDKGGIALAYYVIVDGSVDRKAVSKQLRGIVESHERKIQEKVCGGFSGKECGVGLIYGGDLPLAVEISRVTEKGTILLGLSLVVMFFVAWIQTASVLTGALAATAGLSAAVFTFGLMAALGVPLTPVNMLAANLFMPLGAAFIIHTHGYMGRPSELLWGWLPKQSVKPFLFAGISTIAGFGATAINESPTVVQFGLFGMFGIAMCYFSTVAFAMPILAGRIKQATYRKAKRATILEKKHLLFVLSVLGLITAIGLSHLRVGYDPIGFLKKTNPVRIDFEEELEHFGGYFVPLVVFLKHKGEATEPEILKLVQGFVEKSEEKFQGLHSVTLFEYLSELSEAFMADGQDSFPKSANGVRQLLLFLDHHDVAPFINDELNIIIVLFLSPFRTAEEFNKLERDVERFARANNLDAALTGRVVQFFRATCRIAVSNAYSLGIGVALVLICFLALLRSFRLSVLAIIPNVLPVLGSLAFMGLFGIDLDIGTSIFAACALGLVVDDTGHIVSLFHTYIDQGMPASKAAERAVTELGSHVRMTTFTIVIGLLILNLSDLTVFHSFSQILSVVMLYALFADLKILPSLLAHFGTNKQGHR